MALELGVLAGTAAIGYLLNQRNKENEFETNNNVSLGRYLMQHPYQQQLAKNNEMGYRISSANSYPLYHPEYVKHQQNILSGLSHKTQFKNPQKTEKNLKKHLEKSQEDYNEGFANFIPSNDPDNEILMDNETLLDLKKRPITDFYHNNMVPFYKGSGTNQNMAGTGVASGSYIDGSNVPGNITGINSGFDYTTPFQDKLSTFTGLDDTYMHKREAGPLFSPAEQQTGWVFGSPLFRPDMDRYTQGLSQIRNDLKPVEPEIVGPGLNIDPSIPASGGFHDFTRILPNNVNDYKANQLPGQVIPGKYFSTGLPSAYPGIGVSEEMGGNDTSPGVTKNKPNSFWDQTRYPTMTTKVGFQNNLDYNIPQYQVDFKPNNASRDQISYGLGNVEYKKDKVCVDDEVTIGTGPLGARIPLTGQRSETYMSQDNNIRSKSDCSSWPIGGGSAPNKGSLGQGNILSNWYVNETDRGTVNPQTIMQLNLNANKLGSFWTAEDTARTTTKETSSFSYHGNASRGSDGTVFYSYEDVPKVRTSETTQFSYHGNASRGSDGATFYSYNDEPKSTTKETTSFSHTGIAGIPGFADTSRFQFMGNSG